MLDATTVVLMVAAAVRRKLFLPQSSLQNRALQYAEKVVLGYWAPVPEDKGKIVFNRKHRRTEVNLIKAQDVLRRAYE